MMADEHIRREDALRAVQRQRGANRSPAQNEMLNRIKTDIIRAPAADVAPVRHGRWEHKKNDYSVAWCSKCKGLFDTTWHGKTAKEYFAQFVGAYRYCPRCGAKMCLEEDTYEM